MADYDELKPGRSKSVQLHVTLTQAVRIERGRQLAALLDEEESIERRKKAANEVFASEAKAVKLKQDDLRTAVRDGVEYRQVPVYAMADWELKRVRVVRTDTFELLRSRPMTKAETQPPLFDEQAAAKAKEAKEAESQESADAPTEAKGPSILDLPVAPPPPENIEQCRAAGLYFGRSEREAKGTRQLWTDGLFPTAKQLADLEDAMDRTLSDAEKAVLVEAWRSEACEPVVEETPAAAPVAAETIPAEVMKARLEQMREIGAKAGRNIRARSNEERLPASERGKGAWPTAGYWESLQQELGRDITPEERQSCVLAYEDELFEPLAEVQRAEVLNGDAPAKPKKTRRKKGDDTQPPANAG